MRRLPALQPLVRICASGLAALTWPALTLAQTIAPAGRGLSLEPRLTVQETITSNHRPSDALGEADVITRVSAGLGWRAQSGAVRGALDYTLTGLHYARHSEGNELQNALNANFMADLLPDRLQLLGSARIARSAISAFGIQPGGAGDNSSNVTETRTWRLAPTLHGPLGPSVRYTASVAHSQSQSAGTALGDSTSTQISLHLAPVERARLGWTLDASSLASDFKLGRSTRSDRVFGGLTVDLNGLDLQLTATLGTERSNVATLEQRAGSTWGVGLLWAPSPRVRIELGVEERFFGQSHHLMIEYRLPRTVFALRSARSLSTNGNQQSSQRSLDYNAIFNDATLVSLVPDAALRDALVRQILQADAGFLRSAVTVQDQLQLSVLWTAPRQTIMLLASRNASRRADALSTVLDDLAQVSRVKTSNLALNLTHRLTPISSLALQLSAVRNGSGGAGLSSHQTSAELRWQTRLTPDTSLDASLRRALYDTVSGHSNETALIASYAVRF